MQNMEATPPAKSRSRRFSFLTPQLWLNTTIYLDSPVIVSLTVICGIIRLLDSFVPLFCARYFSAQPMRFFDWWSPLSFWRLLSHSLGHSSWEHFSGNFAIILIVGPRCEAYYSSNVLIQLILFTSFVSVFMPDAKIKYFEPAKGAVHTLFAYNSSLLGAHDLCLTLVLLNSISIYKMDRVPVTFLMTTVAYVSKELLSSKEELLSHVLAGFIGGFAGLYLSRKKAKKKLNRFVSAFRASITPPRSPRAVTSPSGSPSVSRETLAHIILSSNSTPPQIVDAEEMDTSKEPTA